MTTIDDAVLVVDKPVGMTSFDVVRRVRRAARVKRVGHGGTLDPLASGVLPVCLGEATKLAQFLLDADKEYTFTVCFGVETDTDDAAGAVTARADAAAVDAAAVERALPAFRGAITQVPPVYSALKRAGRPLYDYARAGEAVTAEPRAVRVHALELVAFRGPADVDLRVRCSKGTYVRALARDVGRALGVGGHVTALRRTRSGPFALAEAQPLDDVVAALQGGEAARLHPVDLAAALAHLDRRVVSEDMARDLRMGRRIQWDFGDAGRVCMVDGRGRLVAVAEPGEGGNLNSLRVFHARDPGRVPSPP
jgi:tRNA pseudouridine55 synthase